MTAPGEPAPTESSDDVQGRRASEGPPRHFCEGPKCPGYHFPPTFDLPHPHSCLTAPETWPGPAAKARPTCDPFGELMVAASRYTCRACGGETPDVEGQLCRSGCNDPDRRERAKARVREQLLARGRPAGARAVDPGPMVGLLLSFSTIGRFADPRANERDVVAAAGRLTQHLDGRGRVAAMAGGPSATLDLFCMRPDVLAALMSDAYAAGFAAAQTSERLEQHIRATAQPRSPGPLDRARRGPPPCGACGGGRVFVTLPCPHCGANPEPRS